MSTWNEEHPVVLAALKDMAVKRSSKSESEHARSIDCRRAGDARKSDLAMDHAWALENQARGLWEAYHAVLAHEPSDAGGES